MRTTVEENARLGRIVAEKANAASGPVSIVLPLRGVSAIDAAGQPFYNPEADAALFAAIRRDSRHDKVKIIEMDAHINDPEVAGRMAAELLSMLNRSAHVLP